jgi:hypothetical protein
MKQEKHLILVLIYFLIKTMNDINVSIKNSSKSLQINLIYFFDELEIG